MPPTDDAGTSAPYRVPRPPDALPGGPAPWAGLPASARSRIGLGSLIGSLAAAGRALSNEAPEPANELTGVGVGDVGSLRDSAVLVACFEEAGDARVVLTRRAGSLRRHRSEVAFPGGRVEPGEPALDAALREAHEEVGLDPATVSPQAWLAPIVTFASSSIIRPFVGSLDARPELRPHPGEVARVFDVSLTELLSDGAFHEERWRRPSPRPPAGDGRFAISFFDVADETIWGATARILRELCCLAVEIPPR